jgi:hypothetical protein
VVAKAVLRIFISTLAGEYEGECRDCSTGRRDTPSKRVSSAMSPRLVSSEVLVLLGGHNNT